MLDVLFRMVVIGFFGLLGFTNLLVLRGVIRDWLKRRQFGDFTGWSRRVFEESMREYTDKHRSMYEDLMPTILSVILIMIFYISNDLLMTDILVALLIFEDAQIIRNHILKRPPLTVRAALKAKKRPETSAKNSRLFLMDVAAQTIISLFFTILPYIYVMITK